VALGVRRVRRKGHDVCGAKQLTSGLLADHGRRINAENGFSAPNSSGGYHKADPCRVRRVCRDCGAAWIAWFDIQFAPSIQFEQLFRESI